MSNQAYPEGEGGGDGALEGILAFPVLISKKGLQNTGVSLTFCLKSRLKQSLFKESA